MLVSQRTASNWVRGSDLGILPPASDSQAAVESTVSETAAFSAWGESKSKLSETGGKGERSPTTSPGSSCAAIWDKGSSPCETAAGERTGRCGGQTTDADEEKVSGTYLKSGSGETLNVRRGNGKIRPIRKMREGCGPGIEPGHSAPTTGRNR